MPPMFLLIFPVYLHVNRNPGSGVSPWFTQAKRLSNWGVAACPQSDERGRGVSDGRCVCVLPTPAALSSSTVNKHHLITLLSQVLLQMLSQQPVQISLQITLVL